MPENRKKRQMMPHGGCLRKLACLMLALLLVTAAVSADSTGAYGRAVNASGSLNGEAAVDPIGHSEGFLAVLYDNVSGLPTSESNAIAQTGEGFIWIGSYSGLIRYDGNSFERVDPSTGIAGVKCLFVDHLDRLWIGTTDSGLVVMKEGRFSLLKDKHGFVIGGMPGMKYKEYEIRLEPGDKLFLYTDGVPEATDAENAMFGTERMLEALNEDPGAPPRSILENVRRATDRFVKDAEQFDDLTMLCIEYDGNCEAGPEDT